MAKALSENEKRLILADYHTGQYSQRDLARKHDVSLGTISKITKLEEVQNEHLVNAQIALLSAKAILPFEQIAAIMNAAQEKMYNEGLVTNASQLNLIRISQYLSKNRRSTKINAGDGTQEITDIPLQAEDFKNCQEAIDKASITLKVNERHSKIENNNINAFQAISEIKLLDA